MVRKVESRFGKIDILVNNAAAGLQNIPLGNNTLDEWSRTIHTNINGTYLCSREVARSMMKHKKGKIINIASISGFVINRCFHGGSYNVSKSAIVMLTKACAVEWAPYNINVNAVAPGYYTIQTPTERFLKKIRSSIERYLI
jgi:NAD(P)-dependent dehydrogenase (short-subunit alcohol dehydrogenase family)